MRAQYNHTGVTILHLSRHELYRMNPGVFHDMVQIHKNYQRKPERAANDVMSDY